ncbi:unnamed protein product [Cuscuta campestris]|uniref:Uncharacterized protein n=1 Tax=Cuscuta campestris TaxID=132261 RepID=A0A484LCC3_9ASTE|nr:unnamed protein product [Cuscuta campestris]
MVSTSRSQAVAKSSSRCNFNLYAAPVHKLSSGYCTAAPSSVQQQLQSNSKAAKQTRSRKRPPSPLSWNTKIRDQGMKGTGSGRPNHNKQKSLSARDKLVCQQHMRAIPSLKKTEFRKQTAQWSMLFENGSTRDHDLPTAALGGSPTK